MPKRVLIAYGSRYGSTEEIARSAPKGFLDKRMLGMAAKQMVKDTGIHLTEGARNDLRDWDQIKTLPNISPNC